MKKLLKERSLLQGALKDLSKELQALQHSKLALEKRRNETGSKLDLVQNQELRLRDLTTLTLKKEAFLTKRINELKEKIAVIDKKIDKVKTIKEELGNV